MPRAPHTKLALLLVASALVSARAEAAPSKGPSEKDREEARKLADEGQRALDAKEYAKAVELFTEVDAKVPGAPTVLVALAQAYVGLGKWLKARDAFERAAALPGSSPARAKAVAEAREQGAALQAKIPSLAVSVTGAASATILVDGAPPPSAAGPWPLDPGAHTVRAEAPGMVPAEATVTLAEGKAETVTLKLAPPAPVEVAQPKPLLKILGWSAVGVGGASLLVGAVTGGLAVSKHAALAKLCPDGRCHGQQPSIDAYDAMGNAATATVILGAAFAATGVALVLTAPRSAPAALAPKPAPTSAWIAPVVGLGHAGIRGGF